MNGTVGADYRARPDVGTGRDETVRTDGKQRSGVTEAPGGLYQEILENAPRLANRVTRFRREHAEITEGIRRGLAECAGATTPEATTALRDRSVRLFADLVRHRKRGLDLVYEAYHVDIGGES